MVKMSFTNKQSAFDYALYMIAASYFDKTNCTTKRLERNLFIQFKELKQDRQYDMEDVCIAYMDKLADELPKRFFKQNMEVRFRRSEPDTPCGIIFENERFVMILSGEFKGKKSKIEHHIKRKKMRRQHTVKGVKAA